MYLLIPTTRFKKDLKKYKGDLEDIRMVLKVLEVKGVKGIAQKMRPHLLKGEFKDNWECHIRPDRLLIWIQIEKEKIIKLVRVGSHSDIFK
ncbi:type II toxin-antitoxin system YafQ family toxin [Zunongwangia sp. H14]|uniref:type II toxin-antitoxin system YafQ family toxin n=1 Tax=Zunongwangia sp. H14 TaxID=3240792 RepID=UPI003565F7D2